MADDAGSFNPQKSKLDERVIRVFVSSTFRDMQAERDELVLKIFPQLRRLCEERGVTWGEIDLRWGITEEQSQRGEVLPICLEEIRRCRPYFIGLLGERYGWIPDAIPAEILEHEPWIREHADGADKKSVTELEILHGVLNNPEMSDHAFFYFRDPRFLHGVSADELHEFAEFQTDEELQTLTRKAARTCALARRRKLKELKQTIRQRFQDRELLYEPREKFADAKALGEMVLADFTAMIDVLYPNGQEPSPLDRERMEHEAFAFSRTGVYIGRQDYFDRLDAHVASDAAPLAVLGESGIGKSALLANWALRYRDQHPDHFLLIHFIGASPDSANAIGLLRRIMLELKERFDLPEEVPAQSDKIREEFPNWLTNVATRGPIVLVFDALNQLEDVDAAPDIGWLPRVFPKNCRVIVSTLPGRSLTDIEHRGWLQSTPPLLVHPLDEPERVRLTWQFLKQYRKRLSKPLRRQVALSKEAQNPLYLRVLLNELRVFGRHEELGDEINRYLEAKDPRELYGKVIARWEKAYSEGIDLVRDTLSLIWAARRGLSEIELLEVLGQPGRPLPRAIWSPLFLAMSDALVTRSGLLTFAHDFLRAAARETYLSDVIQQKGAHRQLAEYFQEQPTWTDRKLIELPWQLAADGNWQSLHGLLTEQECFLGLQRRSKFELLFYWRLLKPHFDPASSYTTAFSRWSQNELDMRALAEMASELANFLSTAACHSAAEPLLRRALAIDEQSYGPEHAKVATHRYNLALLLRETNRLTEAEPLLRRALAIDETVYGTEHPSVARDLNALAQLLELMQSLAEAEQLYERALDIYEAECPAYFSTLNNLALLLISTNRQAEAELLLRQSLAFYEQSYGHEHPNLIKLLGNLAVLLKNTNRPAQAEPLYLRALALSRTYFGDDHPIMAIGLNNLAQFLQATNRLPEAEPLMRRALAIDEMYYERDHPRVAIRLNNLALLLKEMNRLAEAVPLMRRSVAVYAKFKTETRKEHRYALAARANLAYMQFMLVAWGCCGFGVFLLSVAVLVWLAWSWFSHW